MKRFWRIHHGTGAFVYAGFVALGNTVSDWVEHGNATLRWIRACVLVMLAVVLMLVVGWAVLVIVWAVWMWSMICAFLYWQSKGKRNART